MFLVKTSFATNPVKASYGDSKVECNDFSGSDVYIKRIQPVKDDLVSLEC
jgi:hypothetical protein